MNTTGLDYLYITKSDYHKLIGFNLKLAKVISQNSVDPAAKAKFFKYTGETIAQNLFVADLDQKVFTDSKEFVQMTLDVISGDPSALLMLEVLNSHADFLYSHSLGVSIYSVMITKALGWLSPQTTFKASLAGLYHDIGKKEISRAILDKPRAVMTANERKIYESHTIRGKEVLISLKSFPTDIAEVAFQHHENCMGTGFPRALKKTSLYPLAALVSLANKFCELVIKSPHSEGMTAKEALHEIQTLHQGEFEAEYVKALKKLII